MPEASATTGTLAITGGPEGALIAIDDRVVGRVPATFFVEQGAHRIQISSLGYLRYEAPVAIQAGRTTPLEVRLTPGDTSDPQGTKRPYTLGYFFGASAGLDLEGSGGAGNASFGLAFSRLVLAVRYGRGGGLGSLDSFLRMNIRDGRFTPFVGIGYARGTLDIDTDGDMFEEKLTSAGFALVAGVRFDISKNERTRISLTAESGARFYPDFADVRSSDGSGGYGRVVPLYAGIEMVYGSVR